LGVALVNAPLLAISATGGPGLRTLLHLFDVLAFLSLGCLGVLLVRVWRALPSRQQRWALAGLWFLSALLGLWFLPDDLEHFSLRRSFGLPSKLVALFLVLLLSASVPLAVTLGRWSRRSAPLRLAAIVFALAGFAANAFWSPGDYRGVHAFFGLALAALAASALTEARIAPSLELAHRSPLALTALAVVGCVLPLALRPPAHIRAELRQSSGSVFTPLLNAARARLRIASHEKAVESDWFRSRTHQPDIPPSPGARPKNPVVVLITIDALRADVVNSGKYDAELPNLARIRRESTWFTQARSAGTLTKVSLTALFASSYFSQQFWAPTKGDAAHTPSGDESLRFPELLQRANVRTLNVRSIKWLHNASGIMRGFSDEPEVPGRGYIPSRSVFETLLPSVAALGNDSAFVFSHLSDPHAPYTLGGKGGSEFEGYLREVALVDVQLGRLLALLDAPPFAGRTMLIVSADHGEAFGEHNSRTHGHTLYDEVLHVPLLVRLPAPKERRVDALVSLVDIAPTVLDWMGLPTPGTFMGQSLTGFFRGETPELTRPVAAEARLMQAMIDRDWLKIIRDPRQDSVELYDLKKDPEELTNLADDQARVEKALGRLTRFFETHRLRREGYVAPLVR
jgi:uncharacterized membrane protein YphA (DoxX/SURF4 family)